MYLFEFVFLLIWGKYTGVELLDHNPPVMQETPVLFLGWEDPLEKG